MNAIRRGTGLPGALQTAKSRLAYPDRLRRVSYRDPDMDKHVVFLTNRFDPTALTIAEIYRNRWRVETFFKGQTKSVDQAFLRQLDQRRKVASTCWS